MIANTTRNRFWRKTLAWEAPFPGVLSTRSRVGATARRGAAVRHPIGRPILVCRWVAVDGGRLECRWSIEVIEGSSIEEPKSILWVCIGRSLDVTRTRCRPAFLVVALTGDLNMEEGPSCPAASWWSQRGAHRETLQANRPQFLAAEVTA
jgi:hypothetical protein